MSCTATQTGVPAPRRSPESGADRPGCGDAWLEEAYAEHRARVYARARRLVVDPHLAEEATQEAFVRAWRACHTYDPARGALAGWLLAITAHVSVDLVRARNRRPPLASGRFDAEVATDGSAIDQVLHRAELRDALALISPEQRHAVVETILLDRSPRDVAAELGINTATLRTRVHYGLRRLRSILAAA